MARDVKRFCIFFIWLPLTGGSWITKTQIFIPDHTKEQIKFNKLYFTSSYFLVLCRFFLNMYIMLCEYLCDHNQDLIDITTFCHEILFLYDHTSFLHPEPLGITNLFLTLVVLLFPECCPKGWSPCFACRTHVFDPFYYVVPEVSSASTHQATISSQGAIDASKITHFNWSSHINLYMIGWKVHILLLHQRSSRVELSKVYSVKWVIL